MSQGISLDNQDIRSKEKNRERERRDRERAEIKFAPLHDFTTQKPFLFFWHTMLITK